MLYIKENLLRNNVLNLKFSLTLFNMRYGLPVIILLSTFIVAIIAAVAFLIDFEKPVEHVSVINKSKVVKKSVGTLATNTDMNRLIKVKYTQDTVVYAPKTIHSLMPKIAKEINHYLILSSERYIKGNEDVLLITSPYYPMALSQVEMGGGWSKDDNILAAIGVNSKYLQGHPERVLTMTWKDVNPRPDPDAKYIGPLQLSWNYNNEWNNTKALNAAKVSELGKMFAENGTIRKDITRSIPNSAKPFRMVTGDRCNWTDAVNLLYWAMILDHSQIPKSSFIRQLNEYGKLAFSAMCHNYSGALSYNTDNLDMVYNITETMTQGQVETWCYAIGRPNVVNYVLAGVRRARPMQYKNDVTCNSIVSCAAKMARSNYQEIMGEGGTLGNIPPDGAISVTGDREKTLYPIKVLVAYLITKCRMSGEW